MKNYKNYLSLLFVLLLNQNIYAQTADNNWRRTPVNRIIQQKGKRPIQPKIFSLYQIDFNLLKTKLNTAPKNSEKIEGLKIDIPNPNGLTESFIITKTDVLPKKHQAVGADIQTFFGYNELHPNIWISLDYTNHGFHAMVTGTKDGDYFIDPYQMNDTENYLIYYKKDNINDKTFECLVQDDNLITDISEGEININKNAIETDCKLRTYRLAIACTGEYTGFHGGTIALAQSGIATTINRVNQMFRRDFGVVLNIVTGTSIIYVDSINDPYTNGDIYSMLGDNEGIIDGVIGIPNYDIGHVFGTAGFTSGGLATREGICLSPDKGAGVTTLESPIGDQYDIDFVAHEIAHQFGARHTFNSFIGACSGYLQRNPVSAYEPGSASTIMGYAGLCAEPSGGLNTNVQDMTDAMFHSYTIYEISKSIITGNASQCGTVNSTANIKPVADAGPVFYNIPINTPFELVGNSTDNNTADVHTYSWEQYDLAPTGVPAFTGGLPQVLPGQNIPIATSTDQPNFRTFLPTTNKTRYIPTLDSLVANVMWPKYEMIPSVTRTAKFRLTVRDNNTTCGCTDYDEIDINFDGTKGPFIVNYPNNTGITWNAANSQTVTWDVAGTDNAPVSCANVDIFLSIDGGYTYSYPLALGVPNDGNQNITVPNIGTTTARVKVICSDNIFFDISNNNFTIVPAPVTAPEISFITVSLETFEENNSDGNLDCRPYKDYTVTMQIANSPTGNATVTINKAGNATDIFDYSIIGSPLTFPSGSTTDRSFTVRIIDDGEVDPLENLELTFTISGTSNAIAGSSNQTCLVKINDDEHAPFSGVNPHFEEDFDAGVTFGGGTNNWNDANNSGGEEWTLGNGGVLSASGQSFYISDNGTTNSYNTSNSFNYVSIESPQINGVGKTNQVLTFDYISGGDAGHDYGRLSYDNGTPAGVILFEGGVNAPFVGVNTKKRASIVLPDAVNGNNYNLIWGWTNSSTNPGGVAGKGFEIDNIRVTEGTPGIRIETEVTTVLDEQYLGPFQSIYYYNPKDGNLMLLIENTSSHDYGCTAVEVNRAGKNATTFQFDDSALDVTDKTFKVIPTNNNSSGTYNITLYYSEAEISGWENSTGNTRSDMKIVKTIGNISTVTPANPQLPTTIYKISTIGSFGNDVTLTSTFDSGFSGFAAGVKIDPLPVELLNFNATPLENRTVQLDWSTYTEMNNDYFTIEKSIDGNDWIPFQNVQGAGNSIEIINYQYFDYNPFDGTSYYRLKQTDFDGNFTYSIVRVVNFNVNTTFLVYPNPTSGKITIKASEEELESLHIYNVIGDKIIDKTKIDYISETEIDIDFGGLAKGVYYIRTNTNTEMLVVK